MDHQNLFLIAKQLRGESNLNSVVVVGSAVVAGVALLAYQSGYLDKVLSKDPQSYLKELREIQDQGEQEISPISEEPSIKVVCTGPNPECDERFAWTFESPLKGQKLHISCRTKSKMGKMFIHLSNAFFCNLNSILPGMMNCQGKNS